MKDVFWRYLKAGFWFWFGAVFALFGIIFFPIGLFLPSSEPVPRFLFLGIGGGCFWLGAYLVRRDVRDIARRVRALKAGQPFPGRVEGIVSAHMEINGHPRFYVAWSWQGPDGTIRHGKSPPLGRKRAHHWQKGGEIAVYADPANPENAEADVYGFRTRVQL
jgi:hypothetical protein